MGAGGKDAIKVYLRIRPDMRARDPTIPYEVEHDFDKSKIRFHIDRRLQSDTVNNSVEDFTFAFNRVFEPHSTQEQVFDGVCRDCCINALEGFNSTVFAYGQTGSGKTFSITGGTASRSERGLIPRAISLIYDEINKRKEYHYTVGISYLQIYNDKGSDLLNRGEDAKSLDDLPAVTVHETDDDVILKGLECHSSNSVEEALNLLFLGDTNRLYCETGMNKTSSRSHCIFTISIEARQHGSAMVRRSKLNLVDLAGSERVGKTGASGAILNEAKFINLSLHYLEHVIIALSEQASGRRDHIPYRNSMMTMVLRDSLGGNCRTAMLATAHPGLDQVWETMSTSRFSQRVASIRTQAFINEEQDPVLLVRGLKREVAQLKEQVAFLSGGKDMDPSRELSSDEMERCRELVRRFIDEPGSDLVGAGSDMARIHACFNILRDMVLKTDYNKSQNNNNNNNNKRSSSSSKQEQQTPPPAAAASASQSPATVPTMSSEQEHLLRDEVRRLKTSLQMKENEMTLLFDLVQRHNGPRESVGIQAGDDNNGVVRESHQHTPQLSASSAATAQRPQLQTNITQQQQPLAAASDSSSSSDYNMSALSDPELLKDRTTAFEAFRRSYRKQEQMASCHQELQERIAAAKSSAVEINSLIERMKGSKARIQQLRAERALQEDPDKVDDQEASLLQELHESLRPQWTAKTEALKSEKEKIQHLQLLIKRSQEQLIKDFDGWYGARQNQISTAVAQQQQQQQQTAGNASSSSSGRVNNRALQSSVFSNTNVVASSSSSAQHQQQQNATPAKPVAPTTGNPAVDAELSRMYEAREALRARLASNMQT